MFCGGKGAGVAAVAVFAVLVGCGFGSVARANTYDLYGPLAQRQGSVPGAYDFAEVGPQFEVTEAGTSVDTYVCPSGQSISNWVVVPDQASSFGGDLWQWSSGYGNQINVHVTNWSPPPSAQGGTVYLQLAGSCTTNTGEFPYNPNPGGCLENCLSYPPGDYKPYWKAQLGKGNNGPYAELVKRAFCWSSTYPGCSAAGVQNVARRRFALHNGTDTIDLTFAHSSFARPPAFRLTGDEGCAARQMHVTGENRSGQLHLVLRCHGLKRGALARVQVVKPVRMNFRLHGGNGRIRVRLAKPPGTVKPLLDLGYGPADKSCSSIHDRLRMRSRTFELRVNAHCGRAAGNTVAHLYIGGLAVGASASPEFPGNADLSNPVPPNPASPPCSQVAGQGYDRCINAGIEILQGHLGEGWFHATDSWSSANAPPPTIGGTGAFDVHGVRPGLVLLYQIHDLTGKATGYWIGAKFYSPNNGFKTNASECFVYKGNPTTPAGHKTLTSPYRCHWNDTTGDNPRPMLIVELAGTQFPGDADISNPVPADPFGDRHIDWQMLVKVPSLRDGWFRATDVWTSSKPPFGTMSKGVNSGLQVVGFSPGLVLLYQIYDQAGKPTGYWVGAKFYSPSFGSNAGQCVVYKGNPMTTHGHKAPTSPYRCYWDGFHWYDTNPSPWLNVLTR